MKYILTNNKIKLKLKFNKHVLILYLCYYIKYLNLIRYTYTKNIYFYFYTIKIFLIIIKIYKLNFKNNKFIKPYTLFYYIYNTYYINKTQIKQNVLYFKNNIFINNNNKFNFIKLYKTNKKSCFTNTVPVFKNNLNFYYKKINYIKKKELIKQTYLNYILKNNINVFFNKIYIKKYNIISNNYISYIKDTKNITSNVKITQFLLSFIKNKYIYNNILNTLSLLLYKNKYSLYLYQLNIDEVIFKNIKLQFNIYINNLYKILYTGQHSYIIPYYFNITNILTSLFKYYISNNTLYTSIKFLYTYIYNIILTSLILQYKKHNINIHTKYFEIILKKLINYIQIINIGSSNFNLFDILELNILKTINKAYCTNNLTPIIYFPILIGITKVSDLKSSFLSSLALNKVLIKLIKNSILKKYDWLIDFKSNIITNNTTLLSDEWFNKFKI